MYAYFYIDKDDNLVECDRDTYQKWELSLKPMWETSFFYIKDRKVCVEYPNSELYNRLKDKYGDGVVVMHSELSLKPMWETSFFYIKDRKVCVEYPNSELYNRLKDKYGDGVVVMHSEFSVKDKDYTILTDLCGADFIEDDDDCHRGFYGYYPTFSTNVQCSSNGDYAGESVKLIDCPNYGLEKAIEYHESIILDIVSGKDLKYIL